MVSKPLCTENFIDTVQYVATDQNGLTATSTIDYVATDTDGLTATSTRTVLIEAATAATSTAQ